MNNHYLYVEQHKQYDPGKIIYLSYLIKMFNMITGGEYESTPSNISEVIKWTMYTEYSNFKMNPKMKQNHQGKHYWKQQVSQISKKLSRLN